MAGGQVAAKWPSSLQSHSRGARNAPQGAIDGTLKCHPLGCYHGSHLRDSASSGRWPGLRGGRRTLRAAVLACCNHGSAQAGARGGAGRHLARARARSARPPFPRAFVEGRCLGLGGTQTGDDAKGRCGPETAVSTVHWRGAGVRLVHRRARRRLHLGQRLPVIPVPVRGHDPGHRGAADQLDQPPGLAGRVDEYRRAGDVQVSR
jgi:hypothetical protein